MYRFFTLILIISAMQATLPAQTAKPKLVSSSQESYLYSHPELGLRAMEHLLTEIEQLTRQGKSAAKQLKEWERKTHLADSLRVVAETNAANLSRKLEAANKNQQQLEQKLAETERNLEISDSLFQDVSARFALAMLENTRIVDSLNLEVSKWKNSVLTITKDLFEKSFSVRLLKQTKKDGKVLVDSNRSDHGKADDVDQIEISYDFLICKDLVPSNKGELEIKLKDFKFYDSRAISGSSQGNYIHYKGKFTINTGEKGLNLYKTGRKIITVTFKNGGTYFEATPSIYLK